METDQVVILDLDRMPMAKRLEGVVGEIEYKKEWKGNPAEEKDIAIRQCPVYAKGVVRQLAQHPGLKFSRESDVTRHIGVAALDLLNDPWIDHALTIINERTRNFRRPKSAMDLRSSLTSGFHLLSEEDPDNVCAMPLHFVARKDVLEKINYVKAITGMEEKDIVIVLTYAFGATTALLEVEMRRVAVREWVNFVVYLLKRAGTVDERGTNAAYVDIACEQFKLLE